MLCILLLSTTSVFATDKDESEANDSKQYANTIKIGDTIYGENEGYDWFVFTAPVSGNAKITIFADSSPQREWHEKCAKVYDTNDNLLASAYDTIQTDGGDTSYTFGVVSGRKYYVKVYGEMYGIVSSEGDYHFNVSYDIGKTTIKSVVGGKNRFTVKWNKKSKASFYEIQYTAKSTYKDYAWRKAKKIKVSGKYNLRNVKRLAKKKPYYVRVRVARKIAGKTYYSGWSKKKLVRTK